MDYETALALKNAGFPQKGFDDWCRQRPDLSWEEQEKQFAYVPTLEELIESCGDRFSRLTRGEVKWGALGNTGGGEVWELGATPTEAVARLWLELNKK